MAGKVKIKEKEKKKEDEKKRGKVNWIENKRDRKQKITKWKEREKKTEKTNMK